jgi:hypothetical protein
MGDAMTTDDTGSRWSLWSQDSLLCIGCKGSVLSVGSILSFWSRRAVIRSGIGTPG